MVKIELLALFFSFIFYVLIIGGTVYFAVRLALKKHDKNKKD